MTDPNQDQQREDEPLRSPAEQARHDELQARKARQERGAEAMSTLLRMRKGELAAELADALEDVVRTVRKHARLGKSGSVTLKLDVKPMKGSTQGIVTVTDTLTKKVPAGEREPQPMWTTETGALLFDDPDQVAAWNRNELGGGAR